MRGGVVSPSTTEDVAPDGVSKAFDATNASEASGVAERAPESTRVVPSTVAAAGNTGAVVVVNAHVGGGHVVAHRRRAGSRRADGWFLRP